MIKCNWESVGDQDGIFDGADDGRDSDTVVDGKYAGCWIASVLGLTVLGDDVGEMDGRKEGGVLENAVLASPD